MTDKVACDEALRLLAAHLDEELDAPDHARVERHLAACLSCCSRAEFEGLLKTRIAELGQAPVTQELNDRIQKLVGTFAVADAESPPRTSLSTRGGSMVVITTDQRDVIFDAVRAMYTSVADLPDAEYHFPTGRAACDYVGYPADMLDRLPSTAVESFAGVGHPFSAGVIREGDTVLDIGSGSGTDLLIAALLVGNEGRAIGLDMTRAMREKAAANARMLGVHHVEIIDGNAESIPLPDASVDVVTSNGVINLVPDKTAAIREIHRVLRPGGRMQIADIIVGSVPSDECRSNPQLWAECIVGATTVDDYVGTFHTAGFEEVECLSELDYFAASRSESTRRTAGGFGARSVVMRARKPE